ncbi:MAG: YbhB/YbcL family Raf kinase inhibitor-like protein [Rhodospirillaceae bacterium]|nr:YbhB/YbcL family Raf kinase inhibitor-like protein [Rhodospirillaceae bacterium]
MKILFRTAAVVGVLMSGAAFAQSAQLTLSSPAFKDGGGFPDVFVCKDNKNFSRHSLPLAWTGAPEGTKSFALLMHDVDVHPRKTAHGALHWIVWNIPGSAATLAANLPLEGQLADGTRQGKSVIGQPGYMGPCPPPGNPHHYVMELLALDTVLEVPIEGTRDDVLKAVEGHVLASSALVGLIKK